MLVDLAHIFQTNLPILVLNHTLIVRCVRPQPFYHPPRHEPLPQPNTSAKCMVHTFGPLTSSALLSFRPTFPLALRVNTELLLGLLILPTPPRFPTAESEEVAHAGMWEFSLTHPSPPQPPHYLVLKHLLPYIFPVNSLHAVTTATTSVVGTVTTGLGYCHSSS